MKNKQTYTKGDKPNREPHVAVRYPDKQGTDAYQCISQSRIVGHSDEKQTNNVQQTYY